MNDRAHYRLGARKPLGFSQGMHGLSPGIHRTHVLYSKQARRPHALGRRAPRTTHANGCSLHEAPGHLALLVTGRVPPECASASLGRWTGRVRRRWSVSSEL